MAKKAAKAVAAVEEKKTDVPEVKKAAAKPANAKSGGKTSNAKTKPAAKAKAGSKAKPTPISKAKAPEPEKAVARSATSKPESTVKGGKSASAKKTPSKPQKAQPEATEQAAAPTSAPAPVAAQTPEKEDVAPVPFPLQKPLPSDTDEWTLIGLAEKAGKDRAQRLRAIAGLYGGMSPTQVSAAHDVDIGKVYLWLGRFREGGVAAL